MKKILTWVLIITLMVCVGVFVLYTYEVLFKTISDAMQTLKK